MCISHEWLYQMELLCAYKKKEQKILTLEPQSLLLLLGIISWLISIPIQES